MEKITATRSLTVSSERQSLSFRRYWDVSRTEFATKSDSLETDGSCGELDLSTFGTQPGMVLQMVEPLFVGRRQRVARPFACAENQSAGLVERNSASGPGHSRSLDAASGSTRKDIVWPERRRSVTSWHVWATSLCHRCGRSNASCSKASAPRWRFDPNRVPARAAYPALRTTHSNQRHQLDLIGPRYLKGSRRQWFFLVYRDIYDGAVFVEFQPKPRLETVLAFVVRAWQRLGLPDTLQVDNSELFGPTSHPGSLNRFIRLALLVGVNLTFIPEHEPWRNGSIEHFNGWLQERILSIPLHAPAQVRCELQAMMDTCFHEHIHPTLNFQTTAQIRKNLSPRILCRTTFVDIWSPCPSPLVV